MAQGLARLRHPSWRRSLGVLLAPLSWRALLPSGFTCENGAICLLVLRSYIHTNFILDCALERDIVEPYVSAVADAV
jgi:hypothetical protein